MHTVPEDHCCHEWRGSKQPQISGSKPKQIILLSTPYDQLLPHCNKKNNQQDWIRSSVATSRGEILEVEERSVILLILSSLADSSMPSGLWGWGWGCCIILTKASVMFKVCKRSESPALFSSDTARSRQIQKNYKMCMKHSIKDCSKQRLYILKMQLYESGHKFTLTGSEDHSPVVL